MAGWDAWGGGGGGGTVSHAARFFLLVLLPGVDETRRARILEVFLLVLET